MFQWRTSRALQLAVLASIASLASACGGAALGGGSDNQQSSGGEGTSKGPVKVGLLVSLSGVYAPVGTDMKRGFNLYLQQHHNVLGGHKVDLDAVDEGSTAQSGVAGDTRLAQQDHADVVVGIVSGPTASAGRNIFDAAKIPVLMGNTGSVAIGKDPSPWIWRASYDNGDPGRLLGKKMAKDPSAGKFFLIASDYSGGHETIDGFKQTFPKNRIAGELYTPFGKTSDYSSYLAKIRASGAKNVFSFYAGGEAISFTKQFASFGLAKSVKLYSAGFLTEGSALTAEGKAAKGVLNATRYNWDLKNPENRRFVADYQKKYHTVPTVYAANMFDIGIMLDKALSTIKGSADHQSIRDAIAHLGAIEGVRGKLSFNKDNTVEQGFYLTKVEKTPDGLRNVTVGRLGRS